MKRRLPAEWEEQSGVLLAWPHAHTDWHPCLAEVEPVFLEIAREVSRREMVVIAVPDEDAVRQRLDEAGARMENVRLLEIDTNDTWTRDFGPLTVLEGEQPLLLDFGFNGWGLKFPAHLDNLVTRRLHTMGAFHDTPLETVGLVLEGGSIESDGNGTVLTTAACLLQANRNPQLGRAEIGKALATSLGAERLLWLEQGYLAGDDTDSHVDTLARFCPDETIVHVACDDKRDEHYAALKTMGEELQRFRTRDGGGYRLIPLPWPPPCHDEEGARLPATYANFLIINGAVLVPTYGKATDAAALAAVGSAFPGREIIGIDCTPLIRQHGSLHCVTMQLPKGVLS